MKPVAAYCLNLSSVGSTKSLLTYVFILGGNYCPTTTRQLPSMGGETRSMRTLRGVFCLAGPTAAVAAGAQDAAAIIHFPVHLMLKMWNEHGNDEV